TKEDLMAFLAPAGEIVDAFLPTDRETGRPRGFGFVTFATPEQAAACVEQFNGQELGGRRLNINPAEERGRRPGGKRPGGGGRGPGGGGGRGPGGGGGRGPGGGGRGPGGGGRGGERRRGPIQEFKRGGGGGGRFDDGPPSRPPRAYAPPPEPEGPVYDTSDRQYQEDDEPIEVDEWGQPSGGWQKKKKKGKGSRRNLRSKKRDY
ncbi:MAG: RNA-binding protein, partial [Myxococcota bacterium]